MTTETLEFPEIVPDAIVPQAVVPDAAKTEIAVAAGQALDIERVDLNQLAVAKLGDWRATVRTARAKFEGVVHPMETAAQIKEVRSLRERTINAPLALLRKTDKALAKKLSAARKAVGDALELAEAEFEAVDQLALPPIEAAERVLEEKQEKERQRVQALEAKLATIMGWADLARGKSSADIAKGLQYAENYEIVAADWQEFEQRARDAKAAVVQVLRNLHADQLQRENEAAELAKARLEAERTRLATERIAGFHTTVMAAANADIDGMRQALAKLQAEVIDDQTFGGLAMAATLARDGSVRTLQSMLAEAERKAAELAEANRQARAAHASQALQEAANRFGASYEAAVDRVGIERVADALPDVAMRKEPLTADEMLQIATTLDALQPPPITQDTQESGSVSADEPAVCASSEAESADASPSGDEKPAAHADTSAAASYSGGPPLRFESTTGRHAGYGVVAVTANPEPRVILAETEPDPEDELLQRVAGLVAHLRAAFNGRFPSHPKPDQAWWLALRDGLDDLEPMLQEQMQ